MDADSPDGVKSEQIYWQHKWLYALLANDFKTFRNLLQTEKVNPLFNYNRFSFRDPKSGKENTFVGTCLEFACRFSHGGKFIKELLKVVTPNVRCIQPEPIHVAASRGNSSVLTALLADKRTKVNAVDSKERTALHCISYYVEWSNIDEYEKCMKILLERLSPFDINRPDDQGFSAIHVAARLVPEAWCSNANRLSSSQLEKWRASERLVRAMLEEVRDVLDLDSLVAKGRTARDSISLRFPHLERSLPGRREQARADPHWALVSALRLGRINRFRALLGETDADGNLTLDPNHKLYAPHNTTCLELACGEAKGHEFVAALLSAGADPNVPSVRDEKYPIHIACQKGYYNNLNELLKGCDSTNPNVRDTFGNTALHYLVENWSHEGLAKMKKRCLDVLLSREDLDVNKRNNKQVTALMLAIQNNNKEAVEMILELKSKYLDLNAKFEEKSLRESIIKNYPTLENMISLSEEMCDSDIENEIFDLLHTSREEEFLTNLETATLPNLSINDKQFTLLQRATRYGLTKATKCLLEKGADINETFEGNMSPPGVLAAYYRQHEVLRIFLDHPDFDVNAVDAKGNTALHYVVKNPEDLDIMILLLRRGANIGIRNKLGKIPLGKKQLEDLLDSCITSGKNPLHEDYELVFDYRLFSPGVEDPRSLLFTKTYQSVPGDESVVPIEEEKENNELQSEMHLLQIMNEDEDLCQLLDHPIARSFLDLKWRRVKTISHFYFCIYVAFVVFLNIFILNNQYLNFNIKNAESNMTNTTKSVGGINEVSGVFCQVLAWFSLGASLLFWFILCIRQVIQFTFDPRKANLSSETENYLDWSILFLSVVALFMPVFQPHRHILAFINVATIMLSCAELLVLLSRVSRFAKYVEMLKVVFQSYCIPLVPYCVIVVAFGLSFHTLFQQSRLQESSGFSEPEFFASWYSSLVKTLVMMSGDLDLQAYPSGAASVPWLVLLVLFVLVVTVALLNLLVGLAVGATQRVEAQAARLRVRTRVEAVLQAESVLVNMHNSELRLLKKLSALVLRRRWSPVLFPSRAAEGRCATVCPNGEPQLLLADAKGQQACTQMKQSLLQRATEIVSRRSRAELQGGAVRLEDVDAKLERVLRLLGWARALPPDGSGDCGDGEDGAVDSTFDSSFDPAVDHNFDPAADPNLNPAVNPAFDSTSTQHFDPSADSFDPAVYRFSASQPDQRKAPLYSDGDELSLDEFYKEDDG